MNLRLLYLSLLLGFIFCIYANFSWAMPAELSVKFLDIGQGDSVLIRTPQGRNVLIDGGPSTTILERLGEETSYWLKSFDMLILTHPDLDHLEGLVEVLRRYKVERVLLTGVQHRSRLYQAFLDSLIEKEIDVIVASPEQDWQIDEGVFLDIIGPVESLTLEEMKNVNDSSIVVKLIYGETTMLLPGDAEEDEEHEILLTDSDLRAQVIKAGHHGSLTSSSLPFLNSVQADQAIMMAGVDNQFNHPHLETVLKYDELGIDWIGTKQEGTVVFRSDGKAWFPSF